MKAVRRYKDVVSEATVQKQMFYINLFVLPLFVSLAPDLICYGDSLVSRLAERPFLLLLPYFFFLLFHLAFTLITNSIAVSSLVLSLLGAAAGFSNQNKIVYRDEPVFIGDLYHLSGMDETIASGLSMTFGAELFVCIGVGIVVFLLWLPVKQQILPNKRKKALFVLLRYGAAAACLFAVMLLVRGAFYNEKLTDALGRKSDPSIVKEFDANGYWFGFISTTETLFPSKPAGYKSALMKEKADEIAAYKDETENARRADVIVVQIETLFDLQNYGVSLDYDPFAPLDELKAEGFYGNMVSPKYGGGTAYVEYEVLTGFSSGYSQAAACPYNMVVYDGFPGAPRFFSERGYKTAAIHSYDCTFYNRLNAYPNMGFDKIYFDDSFVNPEMSGEWISDKACIEKTIKVYEELSRGGDNVFMHIVTMQNHSPVYPERFMPGELSGVTSESLSREQTRAVAAYARAFEESCEAIKQLADYLRTVDHDVVLLVYGDHQASIYVEGSGHEILRETGYLESYNEVEDFKELHDTPYLVWANFELDNKTSFGDVPPNMLLVNALRSCGVMRPAYFDYFSDMLKSMNGATANYVVETDSTVSFDETSAEQTAELYDKKLAEYDLIYGKRYLLDICK